MQVRLRTQICLLLLICASCPTDVRGALQPLVPNGPVVALTGTSVASDPSLAGTVIADEIHDFFGLNFKGTYQTRVVRPNGSDFLDFYYRIVSFQDVSGLSRELRDFRVSGFEGTKTSVTWKSDGLGTEPWDAAVRFPQPAAPTSHGINFRMDTGSFSSGEDSYFGIVRTNATNYQRSPGDVYLTSVPGVPFDQWLSRTFDVFTPGSPCDFNHDGSVDAADAEILFHEWGVNPGSPADKNGDRLVDAADAAALFAAWTGDSGPAQAIPEPTSVFSLVGASAWMLCQRRKR